MSLTTKFIPAITLALPPGSKPPRPIAQDVGYFLKQLVEQTIFFGDKVFTQMKNGTSSRGLWLRDGSPDPSNKNDGLNFVDYLFKDEAGRKGIRVTLEKEIKRGPITEKDILDLESYKLALCVVDETASFAISKRAGFTITPDKQIAGCELFPDECKNSLTSDEEIAAKVYVKYRAVRFDKPCPPYFVMAFKDGKPIVPSGLVKKGWFA